MTAPKAAAMSARHRAQRCPSGAGKGFKGALDLALPGQPRLGSRSDTPEPYVCIDRRLRAIDVRNPSPSPSVTIAVPP